MGMNKTIRHIAAWMACFAILLVALAPSISHAITAAVKQSTWVEICTSTGVKRVAVEEKQVINPFSSAKHDSHYEECPFCRIQADTMGPLPPNILAPLVLEPVTTSRPRLFYDSPRTLFVWASTRSRAPPLPA